MAKDRQFEETKRLMGALLRMPPKQHDDMKVSKQRPKAKKEKPGRKGRTP